MLKYSWTSLRRFGADALAPFPVGYEGVQRVIIVLGLAAATASMRLLASMLFEVGGTDPTVYALVTAIFVAVGALAAFWPARRASRVDPTVVLTES